MTLQYLLDQKNMTKYSLSKISGVPNTTIIDICAGRSTIEKCAAKTIQQIAMALGCTMEEIMQLEDASRYDTETNHPVNKGYLECGLPPYLKLSLENMKKSWEIEDGGHRDLHWDLYWGELNADINSAEVDGAISSEQAWYLRETYLRIERNDAL